MSRNVSLYDQVGLSLIIECRTGVFYTNQTGGTACLQARLEGALVPLGNEIMHPDGKLLSPESDLFAYFEGPAHRGTGATSGLSVDDANFIDGVLANWHLGWVQVNRERLSESHEAWVYVSLDPARDPNPVPIANGFEPYPASGVITWTNTD